MFYFSLDLGRHETASQNWEEEEFLGLGWDGRGRDRGRCVCEAVLTLCLQSDGEEPTSPVVAAADEVEVAGDAAGSGGSMSVLDALKGTITPSITYHHLLSYLIDP
jgi:hypothetical protein